LQKLFKGTQGLQKGMFTDNILHKKEGNQGTSTTSIIFPTFNESENILPLIERTQVALQDYNFEIIVVDDDSPDLTWKLVQEKNYPNVKVIRRTQDKGLAKAIKRSKPEEIVPAFASRPSDITVNPL